MSFERLVDRHPRLGAKELAARLVPSHRFAGVRFETYLPSEEHPSQADARHQVERFAAELIETDRPAPRWSRWRAKESAELAGCYLDGGFGVGKTHLLASLWHAAPDPKAYLTFAELVALIGFEGMEKSVATFSGYRLICIDEFELDDVASTLMAVSFLRGVLSAGVRVAATSNTLPDRLGEGRFAADDFKREIAAISDSFQVVRIDGPDFRARQRSEGTETLDAASADAAVARCRDADRRVSRDAFPSLLAHLRAVHPVQVGAMVGDLDLVALDGLVPIINQGDALLFVHLVDELYDAEIPVLASGCRVDQLFDASYRTGGYRKKYGRCESRLAALLAESASTGAG